MQNVKITRRNTRNWGQSNSRTPITKDTFNEEISLNAKRIALLDKIPTDCSIANAKKESLKTFTTYFESYFNNNADSENISAIKQTIRELVAQKNNEINNNIISKVDSNDQFKKLPEIKNLYEVCTIGILSKDLELICYNETPNSPYYSETAISLLNFIHESQLVPNPSKSYRTVSVTGSLRNFLGFCRMAVEKTLFPVLDPVETKDLDVIINNPEYQLNNNKLYLLEFSYDQDLGINEKHELQRLYALTSLNNDKLIKEITALFIKLSKYFKEENFLIKEFILAKSHNPLIKVILADIFEKLGIEMHDIVSDKWPVQQVKNSLNKFFSHIIYYEYNFMDLIYVMWDIVLYTNCFKDTENEKTVAKINTFLNYTKNKIPKENNYNIKFINKKKEGNYSSKNKHISNVTFEDIKLSIFLLKKQLNKKQLKTDMNVEETCQSINLIFCSIFFILESEDLRTDKIHGLLEIFFAYFVHNEICSYDELLLSFNHLIYHYYKDEMIEALLYFRI